MLPLSLEDYSLYESGRSANASPLRSFKLPKLSSNSVKNAETSAFSTSPETGRNLNDFLSLEVPQLNYLKYRKYHTSKKDHTTRYESESPKSNYFYLPQTIRVAPRSTVKVFANHPIHQPCNEARGWQFKSLKKKKTNLNVKQPKALPGICGKAASVNCNIKPALSYGEKLWKLHELALIDFKVKEL
jgi:hypothetical protein